MGGMVLVSVDEEELDNDVDESQRDSGIGLGPDFKNIINSLNGSGKSKGARPVSRSLNDSDLSMERGGSNASSEEFFSGPPIMVKKTTVGQNDIRKSHEKFGGPTKSLVNSVHMRKKVDMNSLIEHDMMSDLQSSNVPC